MPVSSCWNGLRIRLISVSESRTPLFTTASDRPAWGEALASMVTRPPAGVNFTALLSRLIMI
jgi:hypothetical protein